jgi:hypothetical protein
MRLREQAQITLSEDTLTDPKQIRFGEIIDDIDTSLITECVTRVEKFPIGTTAISMGNIAAGKFLYIKPTSDLDIVINTSQTLTLRGGKATKMWVNFTALSLIVSTAAQNVTLVLAGA